ncbi:MAG: YfhO family protein [Coriobacteriales bacterium]|nr:YfhO family protein [Coriobacteriales bacterium]
MTHAPTTSQSSSQSAFARFLARREASLVQWEERRPGRRGRGCYHAYSCLFLPFAIVVLVALLLGWRELIWTIDGMSQYYPFFVYEGQWLRDIVSNLFGGGGLQIPLWEWASGYGADVLTTFDVFLDPLNLVSAITPGWASEWVFQFLVVLRLYLAGLAFVFYARTRGENRCGTVLGALLYALCGAGLTAVRWSSGLHALIFFPVVLAGAERILAGKRPWVFVGSLTLLAIISYYFTYMACILLVGYLAIRVVMVEGSRLSARVFLRWVGVFAGLVLLCLLLAGFVLVPAACLLMGMDRLVDRSTTTPLLYPVRVYTRILSSFLSINEVGSDTFQGFGGLAFLACAALFSQRGSNRALKGVLVVLTAFLLIPAIGSFLNALNYASNRWAWAYALCVSLVLARMTPTLLAPTPRTWRVMAIWVICHALLFAIPQMRTEQNMAGFAAMLAAMVALVFATNTSVPRSALAGALALTLAANGFYFLAVDESGIGDQQVRLNTAYTTLTKNSLDGIALDANDPSWWRFDAAQPAVNSGQPTNRARNNCLVLGVRGIDFYNSVYNDGIDAFHTELAIAGDCINFSYIDLQSRSDLMSLLGVKYYAYRKDGSDAVPYGFSKDREVAQRTIQGYDYRLLQSDDYLSFGSTFATSITREDYLALSPAQRQQALLQAVVLEDTPTHTTSTSSSRLTFEDESMPYTIKKINGVTIGDGTLDVAFSGASITLEFAGKPQADTFLYVTGLKYRKKNPSESISAEERSKMLPPFKLRLLWEDATQSTPLVYNVMAHSDASNMTGYIDNYLPDNHMYGGKDTWLVSLGYSEDAPTSVKVTFNDTGVYTFNTMEVIQQTHEHKRGWVDASTKSTLQDVQLGTNTISGSIDLDEPRLLFVPVAYSRGWSAYVDGQEVSVLRANTGFMALDLPAGHHSIEMRYRTPGLIAGLAVTGVGIVALVALAVVLRSRTR